MNRGDLGANADRLRAVVESIPMDWRLWDIGVRAGVSSEIMLSFAHQVTGVDVNECPPHLVGNPRYRFIQVDSVTVLSENREPIGLSFHDTLHIAEQVMCELFFVWQQIPVGGYAVFHDTNWPDWKKDFYLERLWDRPEVGIERFFRRSESVEIQRFPESHGMTFVRKLAYCDLRGGIEWGPVFEARNQLLAILPDGVRKRKIAVSEVFA